MERLILIRHGETAKNLCGLTHSLNDPAGLSPNGINQIQNAALNLKQYSPDKIYSSAEPRAIESAQIISDILNINFDILDGIQERDFGTFAGRPFAQVKEILDPLNLEDRYTYVPPEGESWQEFETRLIAAIEKIKDEPGTLVVVTHGGCIRVLMPYLLGLPKEASFNYDPANASMTVFDFDGRNFKLLS